VGHESPIEIFWISGSPYSWRVLLALAIKQIPYESRLLSLANDEHRSDEFLRVNPRGRVPALRHGALTMGESVAILRYLDRCFPVPPLFGATPAEEGKINQRIDEIENYLVPNGQAITRAVFGGKVSDRIELLRPAESQPSSGTWRGRWTNGCWAAISAPRTSCFTPWSPLYCVRRVSRPRRNSICNCCPWPIDTRDLRSGAGGSRDCRGLMPPIRPTGGRRKIPLPVADYFKNRTAILISYCLCHRLNQRRSSGATGHCTT